jgi:hypothetical protein
MLGLRVLLKCAPFFGFVGIGLYALFTGLFPSWQEQGWTKWEIYDVGDDDVHRPNSLWVRLGWAKPAKPIAQGKYDEKTAAQLYVCIGLACLALGLGGIIWLALTT